jgi:glycosyltransferase involved in cell wall biosynthesis
MTKGQPVHKLHPQIQLVQSAHTAETSLSRRNPSFSIITVVFNDRKNIEKTVTSVINQTYKNIEYIVIDGGSTDGTIDIIRRHEKFISYWVSEPDKGIYDAMNKGIRMARGDFLYFLNAGDHLLSDHVVKEVAKHVQDVSPDILYGRAIAYLKNGTEKTSCKIDSAYDLYKDTICHQATFASKHVFKTCGEFNTSYKLGADREWYLRALKIHGFRLTYVDMRISCFDQTGVSSRRRIRARLEWMKINFIYFRPQLPGYVFKQIVNKVKSIIR